MDENPESRSPSKVTDELLVASENHIVQEEQKTMATNRVLGNVKCWMNEPTLERVSSQELNVQHHLNEHHQKTGEFLMQEIHEIDSVACSSAQAINNINNPIIPNNQSLAALIVGANAQYQRPSRVQEFMLPQKKMSHIEVHVRQQLSLNDPQSGRSSNQNLPNSNLKQQAKRRASGTDIFLRHNNFKHDFTKPVLPHSLLASKPNSNLNVHQMASLQQQSNQQAFHIMPRSGGMSGANSRKNSQTSRNRSSHHDHGTSPIRHHRIDNDWFPQQTPNTQPEQYLEIPIEGSEETFGASTNEMAAHHHNNRVSNSNSVSRLNDRTPLGGTQIAFLGSKIQSNEIESGTQVVSSHFNSNASNIRVSNKQLSNSSPPTQQATDGREDLSQEQDLGKNDASAQSDDVQDVVEDPDESESYGQQAHMVFSSEPHKIETDDDGALSKPNNQHQSKILTAVQTTMAVHSGQNGGFSNTVAKMAKTQGGLGLPTFNNQVKAALGSIGSMKDTKGSTNETGLTSPMTKTTILTQSNKPVHKHLVSVNQVIAQVQPLYQNITQAHSRKNTISPMNQQGISTTNQGSLEEAAVFTLQQESSIDKDDVSVTMKAAIDSTQEDNQNKNLDNQDQMLQDQMLQDQMLQEQPNQVVMTRMKGQNTTFYQLSQQRYRPKIGNLQVTSRKRLAAANSQYQQQQLNQQQQQQQWQHQQILDPLVQETLQKTLKKHGGVINKDIASCLSFDKTDAKNMKGNYSPSKAKNSRRMVKNQLGRGDKFKNKSLAAHLSPSLSSQRFKSSVLGPESRLAASLSRCIRQHSRAEIQQQILRKSTSLPKKALTTKANKLSPQKQGSSSNDIVRVCEVHGKVFRQPKTNSGGVQVKRKNVTPNTTIAKSQNIEQIIGITKVEQAHRKQRSNLVETLLTKHFAGFDPPSPTRKEDQTKILEHEMALLEAASKVVDSCHQGSNNNDLPSSKQEQKATYSVSSSPNLLQKNSTANINIQPAHHQQSSNCFSPLVSNEKLMNDLMQLNPRMVASEVQMDKVDYGYDDGDQQQQQFQTVQAKMPIFKSKLFSPVMRLDLIQQGKNPTSHMLSSCGKSLSSSTTAAFLNKHMSKSTAALSSGAYSQRRLKEQRQSATVTTGERRLSNNNNVQGRRRKTIIARTENITRLNNHLNKRQASNNGQSLSPKSSNGVVQMDAAVAASLTDTINNNNLITAGRYNLQQKTLRRQHNFTQSSQQEVFRKQITTAHLSKNAAFSKEHFFAKCSSKDDMALEDKPTSQGVDAAKMETFSQTGVKNKAHKRFLTAGSQRSINHPQNHQNPQQNPNQNPNQNEDLLQSGSQKLKQSKNYTRVLKQRKMYLDKSKCSNVKLLTNNYNHKSHNNEKQTLIPTSVLPQSQRINLLHRFRLPLSQTSSTVALSKKPQQPSATIQDSLINHNVIYQTTQSMDQTMVPSPDSQELTQQDNSNKKLHKPSFAISIQGQLDSERINRTQVPLDNHVVIGEGQTFVQSARVLNRVLDHRAHASCDSLGQEGENGHIAERDNNIKYLCNLASQQSIESMPCDVRIKMPKDNHRNCDSTSDHFSSNNLLASQNRMDNAGGQGGDIMGSSTDKSTANVALEKTKMNLLDLTKRNRQSLKSVPSSQQAKLLNEIQKVVDQQIKDGQNDEVTQKLASAVAERKAKKKRPAYFEMEQQKFTDEMELLEQVLNYMVERNVETAQASSQYPKPSYINKAKQSIYQSFQSRIRYGGHLIPVPQQSTIIAAGAERNQTSSPTGGRDSAESGGDESLMNSLCKYAKHQDKTDREKQDWLERAGLQIPFNHFRFVAQSKRGESIKKTTTSVSTKAAKQHKLKRLI